MNSAQEAVREFHSATGSTIGVTPAIINARLRANLILEEATEVIRSLGFEVYQDDSGELDLIELPIDTDLVATAKELADLLYVTYGAAVTFGVDMEPVFSAVHLSNMSKLPLQKRQDGKVLKSENYRPPDIASVLKVQVVSV